MIEISIVGFVIIIFGLAILFTFIGMFIMAYFARKRMNLLDQVYMHYLDELHNISFEPDPSIFDDIIKKQIHEELRKGV